MVHLDMGLFSAWSCFISFLGPTSQRVESPGPAELLLTGVNFPLHNVCQSCHLQALSQPLNTVRVLGKLCGAQRMRPCKWAYYRIRHAQDPTSCVLTTVTYCCPSICLYLHCIPYKYTVGGHSWAQGLTNIHLPSHSETLHLHIQNAYKVLK